MRVWLAVAICVALTGIVAVLPASVVLGLVPRFGVLRLPVVALIGAIVAADAHRLRVRDYATSFGFHPAWLWLLAALWPLVVVPWYITVRERIVTGRTPRRESSQLSRR
jgi:hypothetical protein